MERKNWSAKGNLKDTDDNALKEFQRKYEENFIFLFFIFVLVFLPFILFSNYVFNFLLEHLFYRHKISDIFVLLGFWLTLHPVITHPHYLFLLFCLHLIFFFFSCFLPISSPPFQFLLFLYSLLSFYLLIYLLSFIVSQCLLSVFSYFLSLYFLLFVYFFSLFPF